MSHLSRRPSLLAFLASTGVAIAAAPGCGRSPSQEHSREPSSPDRSTATPPASSPTGSTASPGSGLLTRAGGTAGWFAEVQGRIASSEYAIRPVNTEKRRKEARLMASNRRQGMRGIWENDGFSVAPRTETATVLSLRATAIGRTSGEAATITGGSFAPGGCQSDKAVDERGACLRRAERSLDGLGTEWWENRTEGFEHGFTLTSPPPGSRDAALFVEVAFAGARAEMTATTSEARFRVGDDRTLAYGRLMAVDADGVKLPVRMRAVAGGLRLQVEDRGARYPVVIDPVLAPPSTPWSHESDQMDAGYGGGRIMQVSTAGDVNGDGRSDVIVAYPMFDTPTVNAGRVFVFHGTATGLNSTPSSTMDGAVQGGQTNPSVFGRSVAAAGDLNGDGYGDIVVGSPGYGDNMAGLANQGRIYVYLGSATGLGATPVAAATREGGAASATLGRGLAAGDVNGDGNTDIVVGMITGHAVRVYFGGDNTKGLIDDVTQAPWSFVGPTGTSFAQSVAAADLNGDGRADVIVGSPLDDAPTTNDNRGAIRIFMAAAPTGAFNTALPATPTHTVTGGTAGDSFGETVANAGDVNGDGFADVVVGSTVTERVLVFHGKASGSPPVDLAPTQLAAWNPNTDFGLSLSSAGDVNGDGFADVIVGAPDSQGVGVAYLFFGSAAGLPALPSDERGGIQISGSFGGSVSGAGDVNGDGFSDIIVASHRYANPETNEGRAEIYLGGGERTSLATTTFVPESNTANAKMGSSVVSIGDINGDGIGDVAVAAPDFFGVRQGNLFVYHGGSPSGPDGTADWSLAAASSIDGFGRSVAGVGDIDGDGFNDVVVGAPSHSNGEAGEGCLVVLRGSATGLTPAAPTCTFESNVAGAGLGTSVGAAGDIDGDGYADVGAGAPTYMTDRGRVYALFGSATGLQTAVPWTRDGAAGNSLGFAVAGAGDLNGDGLADVVAGAPGTTSNTGSALVLFGSTGADFGAGTIADVTIAGGTAGERFGEAVGGAGDTNGDGFSDLIVGAPSFANGQTDEGRFTVFPGAMTGVTTMGPTVFSAESNAMGARLGAAVGSAGDVDGDGFGDVVVGAPGHTSGQGRVTVYQSNGTGGLANSTDIANIDGPAAGAASGTSVAGGGDVNGDGMSDLIIGQPGYTGGQTEEGRAIVLLGNNAGRPVLPRALRPAGSSIVQPGSVVTGSQTSFRVAVSPRLPLGRARVTYEIEVRPRGTAFTGVATQSLAPQDFGGSTPIVDQILTVGSLTRGTSYHFRARFRYDQARNPGWLYSRWFNGGTLGQPAGAHVRTDGGLALGKACTANTNCAMDFCADGVCCNNACGGGSTTDCQACSRAAKGLAPGVEDGMCTMRVMGTSCSDGNMCTSSDTCDNAGACTPGVATVCGPPSSTCQEAGVCNPSSGTCVYQVKANGTTCDDANRCTTGEACQAGVCTAGTPVVCTAPDACHDPGTCDPATGMCANAPNKPDGTTCSDSNMCTTGEVCTGGTCMGGTAVTCMASDSCHDVGTCDPASGMCSNPSKADGTTCDDNNMCTTGEVCTGGTCAGGAARTCDDNNVCTSDMCVPATGCVNTMIAGCSMTGGDGGVDASPDAEAGSDGPASSTDGPSTGIDAPVLTDLAADRAPDAPIGVDLRPADTAPGVGADARTDGPAGTVDLGGATPVDGSGQGGSGGGGGTGGTGGSATDGAVARDGASGDARRDGSGSTLQTGSSGCSCEVGTGSRQSPTAPLALLALAGVLLTVRSRRRR